MYTVILSGGVGSRLWPISRKAHPKPFIKMPNGLSILQNTFIRCLKLAPTGILNITNAELLFQTADEWAGINHSAISPAKLEYILEPCGKNTAAAIAIASLWMLEHHGPEMPMLVLPADHMISNEQAFSEAVAQATKLALQDRIVTFGIKPTSPETGYGYIEHEGHMVKRFVEKPSLEKAKEYLATGKYLWNSGMFCFKPAVMLAEMAAHCPDILAAAKTCFNIPNNKASSLSLDHQSFEKVRDESIDYAVMEKSNKTSVIPCDIGWSDVGTWNTMKEILGQDANHNTIKGEVITHNTKNCYIESHDRLIATIGTEDLVIIDTADALLVAGKDHTQDVKHIYNRLAKSHHKTHEIHITAHRPWGSYTILKEGEAFKVKRIEVNPQASLSLQSHKHRSEHWIVVAGNAIIINGEQQLSLTTNQSTYIPAGNKHRLSNPSFKEKLIIIEVQTGNYLGEDDIERFEDIYDRVSS